MKIDIYDKVKLKTGEIAHIVEIYEQGAAYEADIEKDGDTETDTIKHSDIDYVFADASSGNKAEV